MWLYLGFKHNMCLLGDMFSLFDCCFLLDASFSEQVFFHCKGKEQFEKEKLKSNKSQENSKSRKLKSEKASLSLSMSKSREVQKSKSVERCHFQFRKVETSKRRKVEKKKGFVLSFEKSKNRKVKKYTQGARSLGMTLGADADDALRRQIGDDPAP